MSEWVEIDCRRSDEVRGRPDLSVGSSFTNFVGGEVIDISLPGYTRTEWWDDSDRAVLIERLDAEGCRHWERVEGGDDE